MNKVTSTHLVGDIRQNHDIDTDKSQMILISDLIRINLFQFFTVLRIYWSNTKVNEFLDIH